MQPQMETTMSISGRRTASLFEVPAMQSSAPFHSRIPERSASTESPSALPGKLSRIDEANNLPGRLRSRELTLKYTSRSTRNGLGRARPSSTTRLLRRLRERTRGCSLWDALVFCSFIGAAAVFIGALAGVGYRCHLPESTHFTTEWRGSPLEMFRHTCTPRSVTGSEIRRSRPVRARREAAEEPVLEDAEKEERAFPEEPSKEIWPARAVHIRPRLGARTKPRHRMLVVRGSSKRVLPIETNGPCRHAELSGESRPSRPNHSLCHERFSRLIFSPELAEYGRDHEGEEEGEDQWGIVNEDSAGDN